MGEVSHQMNLSMMIGCTPMLSDGNNHVLVYWYYEDSSSFKPRFDSVANKPQMSPLPSLV